MEKTMLLEIYALLDLCDERMLKIVKSLILGLLDAKNKKAGR